MKSCVKLLEEKVTIDSRRVVLPSQLELDLEKDDDCSPPFLITLGGFVIDQFSDEASARRRYTEMREAIRNGDYSLIFDSELKPSIDY